MSLTSTILPTVISVLGVTDDFSARIDRAGFAVYSFMWWSIGGWAARRVSPQSGAVILGLVGLISAAIFAGMTYGAEKELLMLLLLYAAAGPAYGTFGGMLIGMALGDKERGAED